MPAIASSLIRPVVSAKIGTTRLPDRQSDGAAEALSIRGRPVPWQQGRCVADGTASPTYFIGMGAR